jgi:hypothetical protein
LSSCLSSALNQVSLPYDANEGHVVNTKYDQDDIDYWTILRFSAYTVFPIDF